MNYYFLLEDEKSLLKVLPKWFEYMGFRCMRVPDIAAISQNNYILQSGQGVTQLITKVLFDTIDTIIENPNKIDKLVIILDTEELTVQQRKQQVMDKISSHYTGMIFDFEICIFVCNHCFESWLLGKSGLYPASVNKDSDFYPYYIHYDIENNDPENMSLPLGCTETIAKYHFHYLSELFRYKKIRYTKKKPDIVMEQEYFNALCKRIKDTGHIDSFKQFVDFITNEES